MNCIIASLMVAVVCLAGCATPGTHGSPESWNAIAEGMTREEIVSSIGIPSAHASTAEVWRSAGWELHVTYGPDGRATTVVRMLVLR